MKIGNGLRSLVAIGLTMALIAYEATCLALTLEAAVAEALLANPELRSLEARLEVARRQVAVAHTYAFNPEINFEPGLERHIGVAQTLEWPGKRALRQAIARGDVAAAEMALGGFRVSLAAEVSARFYDLLADRRTRELRRREVEVAGRVFEAARRRVAAAFAPVTERSTAEVELVRAKRDLREAEKAVEQARGALTALIGRDPSASLEPEGELAAPAPSVPLEALRAVALERHPDVLLRRNEVEQKQLAISLARQDRIPDVAVEPFYEYDSEHPGDNTVGVGLKLPLPLWNIRWPKIAAAEAEKRGAEAALEKAQRDVATAVAAAYTAFVAAKEEAALYSPDLLTRLESELAATEEGYARGELPFLALLEVRRTYFGHVKDYYSALAAARVAEAELAKAAGVSLEELR